MKTFFTFFGLDKLFYRVANEDRDFFFEAIKSYASIGNAEMVKRFLENYARAATERDVTHHLRNGGAKPDYTTYQEIKKLLDFIEKIEKNVGQSGKKTIGLKR